MLKRACRLPASHSCLLGDVDVMPYRLFFDRLPRLLR